MENHENANNKVRSKGRNLVNKGILYLFITTDA